MKIARNKSRLSIAYSICKTQTRQFIQRKIFSIMILLSTRNFTSRIEAGKKLIDGSESFHNR